MFTDIVGYTAMMQKNNQQAIATAKDHEAVLNLLVPKYGGVVQNLMGDGSLCLFDSASNAVECAKEVQLLLIDKIPLRIGVHDGEVTIDNGNAYGDGVNVASRIESSGHEGIILFSKHIHDKIKNNPDLKSKSVGMFRFKNVERPMEIFALIDDRLKPIVMEELKSRITKVNELKKYYTYLFGILVAILITIVLNPGWRDYFETSIDIPSGNQELLSLAIFPFKTSNHEDIDYLEEGMMTLLHTKFSLIEGISILDPTICNALYLKYEKSIDQIMQLEEIKGSNISFAISGNVLKIGTTINLIGYITDTKGSIVASVEKESIHLDSFSNALNAFSIELISKIKNKTQQDFTSEAVMAISDFNVLKEYMIGEQLRRDGNYEAKDHYLKVIKMDSTFAFAWFRLLQMLYLDPLMLSDDELKIRDKAFDKVMENKDQVSSQFNLYLEASNDFRSGQFLLGTSKLKLHLKRYGDNIDLLQLLGQALIYSNTVFNKPIEEGFEYLEKASSYVKSADIELELFQNAIYEKDYRYLSNYLDEYKSFGYYSENYIENLVQGEININNPDTILSLINSVFNYELVMNGSHNFDLLSKVIRLNKSKYDSTLNLNPFKYIFKTTFPLTQGKYEKNMETIPSLPFERIYERGYYLSEPNFLPFTLAMAIKVLNSSEYHNIYDPKDPFFVADKAMYHLVADQMDSTNKYLNILEGELYSTDSTLVYKNKEELIFNYYRVKASIARRLDQNVDVLKYLDTIYSNIIPIENFLDILYEFYGGLKIMEAETLIDLGELERAKLIYTNCEKLIWNSNSLYILYTTPLIKYRLGYIYYLQGDFEKATQLFKYFVDIYKECDDSYQHHVRYAEGKIQEYVESIQ